jgi:hypothetical protein
VKIIEEPRQSFTVELTREDVEFIRTLTQKPLKVPDYQHHTRVGIFVCCSRLLGHDVNDDGSISR